jgi:trigger factor
MTDAPSTSAPAERSFRHTIRREPGSRVELEVEVDADRLGRQVDRVFERHNQRARIPGFRPGKAPRAMYERTYGVEHLWEEAAEEVVEETYRDILDLESLSPLDKPSVDISQLEPGKPLRWKATVVVRPDVALGGYAGHGATVEPSPPTDEEIAKTLEGMREAHAQLVPLDREARAGDVVMVDIDVTVDGKAMPPFARNAHVEAGRATSIAGLAEAFVGMKAGQSKTEELAFPDDGSSEQLKGKKGLFTIRVTQVAEKKLPALDDEFAKTVGVKDIAELRRAVRNELAHAAFHEARDAAAEKMLDHAVETAAVEVPDILVDDELDHLVADLRERVREQGLTLEQFLLQARKTEEELRKEWRPAAERRAKSNLVLDAIAKKENVTVSSNELAAQVAMTPLAQQDARALRDPVVLASLARSIRNRKTVDKLIGLDSPDAEQKAIEKAGGEVIDYHGAPPVAAEPEPKLIIPERSDATPEGREALRAMLEKKD